MAGPILIVDGTTTRRIALKATLASAFHQPVAVATAAEAVAAIADQSPGAVIIGPQLPDGDPLALCRRLRADPVSAELPVLAIAPSPGPGARSAALTAGADEVLPAEAGEALLLAQIRCLLRACDAEQELRLRDGTDRAMGFAEETQGFARPARVGLVAGTRTMAADWAASLAGTLPAPPQPATLAELLQGGTGPWDALVIRLPGLAGETGPSLLADLRARRALRHARLIVAVPESDLRGAGAALDLGADAVTTLPTDPEELSLRLAAQIRRKRTADRLRDVMKSQALAAVTDPLTGLYNRRYVEPYLASALAAAQASGRPCALLAADLDHFKRVNDAFGHAAGDRVLVEVARRLRENVRAGDLVARTGGEEFLIVMPDTTRTDALFAADRLRRLVRDTPVEVPGQSPEQGIRVTLSIGLMIGGGTTVDATCGSPALRMLEDADHALYEAKTQGRDRVRLAHAVGS